MKKLHLATILLLLTVGFTASAQTYEVPKDYVLKAKEDYTKYEDDVIKTVDWLQQTSWTEQTDKRKKANTFLMAWITGSPSVSININADVLMKFCGKNGELLFSYMGGYTKFALQHKSDFTNAQGDIAGVKAMVDKYSNDPGHVKDKAMEKLVKLNEEGKLEDWVKTDFEKK